MWYDLSIKATKKLIKSIMLGKTKIHPSELLREGATPHRIIRQNGSSFTSEGYIKDEKILLIKAKIHEFIKDMNDVELEMDADKSKVKNKVCKIVTDKTNYQKIREEICENDDCCFVYNFNKSILPIKAPIQTRDLQRSYLHIINRGIPFNYPIQNVYKCPECNTTTKVDFYKVISQNNKWKCRGTTERINADGEVKIVQCKTMLQPDDEAGINKETFYYDITYSKEDGNNTIKLVATAVSFNFMEPGIYDCVYFSLGNPNKKELMHIIDYKRITGTPFTIPQKEEGKNYLFTLQETFDKFIETNARMNIMGLYPIKLALLIQAFAQYLDMQKLLNVQVVGDAGTGKTLILTYYGYLLSGQQHKSTDGISISAAAMRGTETKITVGNKITSISVWGHLGTYRTIHIDEAGENKDLIQNLKIWLLKDEYAYDKVGGDSILKARLAHVNISENIDREHLGRYYAGVKKLYKDENITYQGQEKKEWNDTEKLDLPLYKYENKYLQYIIKQKRQELADKKIFWIDGYEMAVHNRFPFYFYLVKGANDRGDSKIEESNTKAITDGITLQNVLYSDELINFLKSFKIYKEGTTSIEKIKEILMQYNINTDKREQLLYYMMVNISRIVNKRKEATEEDYNILRYFLEKINQRLSINDTFDFLIAGPPNWSKIQQEQKEIEDHIKIESTFGLPEGEFNE
jgi:hypothetical protein